LSGLKATDPDLGVVVEGSRAVDYQNMVDVLDVLQQLDITKIGLATEAANLTSP
jgi:biopolymer transport protein ExbD